MSDDRFVIGAFLLLVFHHKPLTQNQIRSLEKIAWLPSIQLGKQPYEASRRRLSRKEDGDGGGYAPLGSDEGEGTVPPPPPPGYQHVEILPVLPIPMVRGVGSDCDEPDSSYRDPSSSSSSLGDSDGPIFEGTAAYLPHTKGHVLTVVDERHKRLYDDLVQLTTDDQQRFMVTAAHPAKEGVLAEYGVLCQVSPSVIAH